jgi:hypothetical protein
VRTRRKGFPTSPRSCGKIATTAGPSADPRNLGGVVIKRRNVLQDVGTRPRGGYLITRAVIEPGAIQRILLSTSVKAVDWKSPNPLVTPRPLRLVGPAQMVLTAGHERVCRLRITLNSRSSI